MSKCNDCTHKSEKDIYDYQVCIRCEHNPYVIHDNFEPKVKEISPEKAGELWGKDRSRYMTTERQTAPFINTYGDNVTLSGVIHNKNGWTRLFPPVPDESVERIEIEGVTWATAMNINGNTVAPLADTSKYLRSPFSHLVDKLPHKMILEFTKP